MNSQKTKTHTISQDGIMGNEMKITPKYIGRLFGPELEYFTVKKENGKIIPVDISKKFSKSKFYMSPDKNQETDQEYWMKPELTSEQIELNSAPTESIKTLEKNLNSIFGEALNIAKDNGAYLLPSALFPFEHDFKIFPNKRYHELIKIIGPSMKKNAPRVTSDQINVGGLNEQEAFETFNLLRELLPFYIGFSAASPFIDGKRGEDLSERVRVYNNTLQRFPELSGIPPKINSMEHYVSELEQTPIMQHPNIYYKSIRPMPQRGVAGEVRIMDKQPTIKEHLSFVALTKGILENSSEFTPQKFLSRDFYKAVNRGIFDVERFSQIIEIANKGLSPEEQPYLAPLKRRLYSGTIAEKLIGNVENGATISEAYLELAEAAESETPYI